MEEDPPHQPSCSVYSREQALELGLVARGQRHQQRLHQVGQLGGAVVVAPALADGVLELGHPLAQPLDLRLRPAGAAAQHGIAHSLRVHPAHSITILHACRRS